MERAGKHEIIIAGEFAHARVKFAIVDEAAGLADNEETEHNPSHRQHCSYL